MTSAVVIRL